MIRSNHAAPHGPTKLGVKGVGGAQLQQLPQLSAQFIKKDFEYLSQHCRSLILVSFLLSLYLTYPSFNSLVTQNQEVNT